MLSTRSLSLFYPCQNVYFPCFGWSCLVETNAMTMTMSRMCVPWRRNGKGMERESTRVLDRVVGTEREPGIFLWKKLPTSYGIFFLKIASESEKVFARILDEFFRCLGLPKINVFRWTIENIMTLTPPPVFWYWHSFHSLTKKCPWWW